MTAETDPSDGNFVPLPQGTLVDTRNGTGLPQAPISGPTTYGFQVTGVAGVPSTGVAAVALTVTTTNSTSSSQLTIFPAGATRPGTASAVTNPGDNRQNSAYVATGTDGKIWVYIDHDATDLVVRVTGYFSVAQSGDGFNPVTQTRVLNTKTGVGATQAQIPAGGWVTFSVASAGVPTSATALAVNFTTYSAANGTLTAGPSNGASNTFTGIGFGGDSTPWADAAFVQLTSTRMIKLTNNASVPIDVLVDVSGYFAAPDAGGGFTPDQARVYDTANNTPTTVPAGGTVFVKLLGAGGIPAKLVGSVAIELTTTNEAQAGYLRAWPADATEPTGSSVLNFQGDDTITNSTIVQTSAPGTTATSGGIDVHNVSSGTLRLVVDVQGWFAPYYDPNPGTGNAGGPGKQSFSHFTDFSVDDRSELHVNEATGGEWLSDADVNIAGVGLNLAVGRNYNSRSALTAGGAPVVGAFGPGWSSDAADVKLVAGSGSPASQTFYGPTGTHLLFTAATTGSTTTYTAPNGLRADLTSDNSQSPAGFILNFRTSGQKWTFNSAGLLLQQVDRNANKLVYNYGGGTQLVSITDTHHQLITFTWSAGRITQITDTAGRQWSYGYTNGDLTSYTDPTGAQTAYAYDTNTNLASITNGAGAVTLMTGDVNGRITKVVQHPTASTMATTSFLYDNGRTRVTDDNGNTTTFLVNGLNYITDVFDARQNNETIAYNSDSSVQSYTPAGDQGTTMMVTNTYQAGGTGNLTNTTLGTGAAATASYVNGTNSYQPTTTTSTQGNKSTYTYDGHNNVTGVQVNTKSGALASTTTVTRNGAGQVLTSVDGNGNTTTYHYDMTAAPSTTTGELDSITYAGPRAGSTFTYDGLHRVASVTDGNGTVSHYQYDADDRVTHIDDSGADPAVTFTYDQAGNLTARTDSSGTESSTFDGLNRITAQTLAKGGTTAYTYDGAGNLLTLTDAGGTTSYGYFANNEVQTVTDPHGNATTFTYDPDGNRTQELFADGTKQVTTYDGSGRIHSLIDTLPNGSTVASDTYSYANANDDNPAATNNDSGLQQSVTDSSGVKNTYGYDGLDELTNDAVTNGSSNLHHYQETYDAAGNRLTSVTDGTTTTAAYNASDQLCWTTTTAVTGNSCTAMPSGAHSSYTYDGAGDLTAVTNPDSTTTGYGYTGYRQLQTQGTLSFTYGGTTQNERYTSADSSAGGQSYVATQSLLGLTARLNTTTNTTTAYTRTPSGALIAASSSASDVTDYLTDAQGSTISTVNASTGTQAHSYTYDPTGNLLNPAAGDGNPYRYTGAYQDQPTGTYAIGARNLNTATATWTQPDPSGKDANPYAYAGNDPINNTDPTGLFGFGNISISVSACLFVCVDGGVSFDSSGVGFTAGAGAGVDAGVDASATYGTTSNADESGTYGECSGPGVTGGVDSNGDGLGGDGGITTATEYGCEGGVDHNTGDVVSY